MKKTLIILFFGISQLIFAQTTRNPRMQSQASPDASIVQVELTEQYTIVSMTFRSVFQQQTQNGDNRQTNTQTISINPKSFLGDPVSGKRFRFMRADNIPEVPNFENIESGRMYSFTVYYERLSPGIEEFDMIEQTDDIPMKNTANLTYWNFIGVKVTNPARNLPRNIPPVVVEPPRNTMPQILVTGKVLDARTRQPISAKIVSILERNNRKLDSTYTQNNSDYRLVLSPEMYDFEISAEGYMTSIESLDLSRITGNQQINQNYYLTAAPQAPPAPVSPTKITISGRVLDAATKQAITAKIVYLYSYNNRKIDSLQTNSGNYSFDLKPDVYDFVVSSKGYVTAQKNLDISKMTGSQQMTQNIYLNPAPIIAEQPKSPPPVVENRVVVTGKIMDAKTKQVIAGKIVLFSVSKNQKVDSLQTTSGDFRFDLKPDSYDYLVSSKGYISVTKNMDFSKMTGSQAFSQNVYLNAAPVVVETPKPTPVVVNKIIVSGRVLDSKTKYPIEAKIVYFLESNNRKIDSMKTSKTVGDYKFELKPATYYYIVSANGYESSENSLDLSKMTGTQEFTQNVFLNPVPVAEVPIQTSPIRVEENKFRLDKVYFEMSESTLLPASYEQLNGLVKMMKDNQNMTIQVEGHTDNVGDKAKNYSLSVDRAFAVRQYLVDKGIAGSRVKFKGYGQDYPIASNNTEDGKAKNRRVEFVILTK